MWAYLSSEEFEPRLTRLLEEGAEVEKRGGATKRWETTGLLEDGGVAEKRPEERGLTGWEAAGMLEKTDEWNGEGFVLTTRVEGLGD